VKRLVVLAALCICAVSATPIAAQGADAKKEAHTAGSVAGAKLFSRAADLQNRQDWDASIATWRAFLRQHPEDPLAREAHNYLGVCLLQKESYQSAATEFEKVFKEIQDDEIAEEAHMNLAWCYYSQGFDNSQEHLRKAAKIFSAHAKRYPKSSIRDQALFYLAESLMMTDRPRKAMFAYEALVEDHPDSPLRADALYALGAARLDGDDTEKAQLAFDQLARQYPDHEMAGEAAFRQAEALMAKGDWNAAAEAYQAVSAKEADGTDYALLRLGLCLERLEQFDQAAAIYERVPGEYPDSEFARDAVLGAARSFALAHDVENADKWLSRVELDGPDTAMEVAHWKCRLQLYAGENAKAVTIAKTALDEFEEAVFRTEVALDHAEAMSLIPSSRVEAAKEYLQIAKSLPDGELQWRAALGAADCLLFLERFDEASALATVFLDNHPQDEHRPAFQFILSESHRLRGDQPRAREILETLLADHAEHPLAATWRRRLARVLLKLEEPEAALALLARQESNAATPQEKSEALFFKAKALDALAKTDEAIEAYWRAHQAHPEGGWSQECLLAIADLQNKSGNPDRAESTLRMAQTQTLEPGAEEQAKLQLAETALNAGRPEKATELFAELGIHSRRPKLVPHALFGQAYSRLYQRDYEQSRRLFTQFIRLHTGHTLQHHAFYGRAMAHGYRSEYESGIRDLDFILAVKPQVDFVSNARYLKGLYQYNLARHAGAIETFETLLVADPQYGRKQMVLYQLAISASELGHIGVAVQWITRLTDECPDSKFIGNALVHVAEQCFENERFELAERLYDEAIERNPAERTRQTALYKLGWSRYRQKDFQGALQSFQAAGETQLAGSRLIDVKFMQAECLFELQEMAQALALYQPLREPADLDQPTKLVVLHHGATCLQSLEQWDASIDWLQDLLVTKPEAELRSKTLLMLGRAYASTGESGLARRHFIAAKSSDCVTTAIEARVRMGQLLANEQQLLPALREFQQVMYGFDQEMAVELRGWKALGAVEAGRCCLQLADLAVEPKEHEEHRHRAKEYFRGVVRDYADLEISRLATQLLNNM
jgi:TolA-binding protein